GQVVGTLNVESRDTVRVTEADFRMMVALSEHVDVAIERARLYTEARRSESRFRALVRNASDVITILDADDTIRYQSPAIERVFGYAEDELVGRNAFELVHPEDRPSVTAAFAATLDNPTLTSTAEFRFRHKDGSWRWLESTGTNLLADPAVGGFVVNTRDITERKEIAAQLWHQAHHDALTGLPNRVLFLQRLEQALAWRGPDPGAVLSLDLDGFKTVNDSLGHESGDRLLVAAAERLAASIRAGDMLARFGGDEFTVLLERMTDAGEATRMAERLLEVLAAPFTLNEHTLVVTASIGIALSAPELSSPTDLLRAADVALYRAKASGQCGIAVFDARRDAAGLARLRRETELRQALARDELRLHYQPEIDLATGRIVGVEALVRWQHPHLGLVEPATFIPLAEDTGLIVPLGLWVLEHACRQMMAWTAEDPTAARLDLSVNVSPLQMRDPEMVVQVARILDATGFPPQRLVLEITEQGLVDATEATDRAVEALVGLGVRLAIDDFGAYQAGLGYLRRWPMGPLKLDRMLVGELEHNARSRAIVAAVVTLAATLGMTVIGEGIETAGQLATLRELGCNWGQGFALAVPQSAEELRPLLLRQTPIRS
ncbi:MAG TPA: EAL domain-containing protein, partial [Thermomicrobiales bacterium]|nr:EAL domain-containing protein [Thermomicrobiales bacterium]